jgi:hypothetical protein
MWHQFGHLLEPRSQPHAARPIIQPVSHGALGVVRFCLRKHLFKAFTSRATSAARGKMPFNLCLLARGEIASD